MLQRKRYRAEMSRDPKVWMKWLEEMEENENEIEEDPLEIEKDVLNESVLNTNTEEETSDTEILKLNESDMHGQSIQNKQYIGTDMVTKWSRIEPNVQIRTRSSNIITHLPGPKGIAHQAKSEIECIRLFITDSTGFLH